MIRWKLFLNIIVALGRDRADANIGWRKLDTTSYKTDEKETSIRRLWLLLLLLLTPGDSPASASTCTSAAVGVATAPSQTRERYRYSRQLCQEYLLSLWSPSVPVEPAPTLTQEVGASWWTFDIEEGSWKCDSCMVRNKKDAKECVSCSVARPGSAIQDGTGLSAARHLLIGCCRTQLGQAALRLEVLYRQLLLKPPLLQSLLLLVIPVPLLEFLVRLGLCLLLQ